MQGRPRTPLLAPRSMAEGPPNTLGALHPRSGPSDGERVLAIIHGDVDETGNLRFQRLREDRIQLSWAIDAEPADTEGLRKIREVGVAELGADRVVELRHLLPADA